MEKLQSSYVQEDSHQLAQPKKLQLSQIDYTNVSEHANLELASNIPWHQLRSAVKDKTTVSVDLSPRMSQPSKVGLLLESTLELLTLHSTQMESNCPVGEAVKIFNTSPLLPGIIITEQEKFIGVISRRLFFEYMSRPYSWQLFAKLPIRSIYYLTKKEFLIFPISTKIVVAARQCLQRSPELLYEPVIVEEDRGLYKLLDVHQLMLAQSEIQESLTEALTQAEAKYRGIFENAVDGIFQTTVEGRYISVNPALARIYGYNSPKEVIKSFTDIGKQLYVDPHRRAEFIAAMTEHGSVSQFESQVYRQDGSIIWVSENARIVYDNNGSTLYYEGTVENITERKQAEESLRQSEAKLREKAEELQLTLCKLQQTQSQLIQTEKMSSLGQLLAGVAHEINNPVNSIYNNIPHTIEYVNGLLNLLQLYQKHYPEPPAEIIVQTEEIELEFIIDDLPQILSAIQTGGERISEIVLNLRNFSRLDGAKAKPSDIREGIDSTLLILHHRLKAKGGQPEIQVIKEYGDIPLVECYPGQLNQVFMNLLGNAIDALEQITEKNISDSSNPTIWISTKILDNYWVRIRIADNAQGIKKEICQRMFEPFFTTKPQGKGTGLGLSISKQIVEEKHNGRLICNSEIGKGTEFLIDIPICQC